MLKIMEILRTETDELNPLTTAAFCAELSKTGVTCDRRTLARDITLLTDAGYEIMTCMVGHEKAYYIEDRSMSVPELKILIDAVQAASFITRRKTDELIGKIAALGGSHRAEILKGSIVVFNTRKHKNEAIYYNVGFLEEAVCLKHKVSFFYFDLDERGCRVYRQDKHRYIVEPMALVFNEDNYYLMTYNSKHGGICNYRVDRMESVEPLDEPVSREAILHESGISDYTEQVFKMYGGEKQKVRLAFDRSLIGVVFDKFGEDTLIEKIDTDYCRADVEIQISPTFRGWLAQFGDKMRVVSPDPALLFADSEAE